MREKEKEIAPSNICTFRKHIKEAIGFFKNKDIREIRKIDLLNFSKHLREKGLSPKTVKNHLQTFHAFLTFMKKMDVTEKIPDIPEIELTPSLPRWVDTELQREIYEHVPDQDKPIFAFLMLTGARPGEARVLRVKDVNLKAGIITIKGNLFEKRV